MHIQTLDKKVFQQPKRPLWKVRFVRIINILRFISLLMILLPY